MSSLSHIDLKSVTEIALPKKRYDKLSALAHKIEKCYVMLQ